MNGRLAGMLDPAQLFDLQTDSVELVDSGAAPDGLVLLHQLHGFIDAGQAGTQLSKHILASCEHDRLAVFDHDQLHDYRSRRPTMVFDANQWKSVEDIELVLYRVTDSDGVVFLLLTGPEPDTQWDRYSAAVIMIAERFNVRITMSGYGIPMAVPHTRPLTMTAHATDSDLVNNYRSWIDRVEVPGSAVNLVQFRLGQAGRRAMGFAVHVPHYLAQANYPLAAKALADAITEAGGPRFDLADLTRSGEETVAEINTEMTSSAEVTELVSNLEQAYDAVSADTAGLVPSADELGAEFERYLAEQDKDD